MSLLQIPTHKPLPAILIVLLSLLFSPSMCFLDLQKPLIFYSDSACLDHAQPFLEPEQRGHLQGFVKIVEPCSFNYGQTYPKWIYMSYLISPFFKQEENTGKQQQKIKKPIQGKPKHCTSISTD